MGSPQIEICGSLGSLVQHHALQASRIASEASKHLACYGPTQNEEKELEVAREPVDVNVAKRRDANDRQG